VHLVKINDLQLGTLERDFDFLYERRGFQRVVNRVVPMPAHGALGKDVGLARRSLNGPTDDLFGVAQTVDGCGVDPFDAEIERAVNGADGVCVILRAPGILPVASADSPSAKPDRSETDV
jgi:hypothetical protein